MKPFIEALELDIAKTLHSLLDVSSEQDKKVYDLAEALMVQLINEHSSSCPDGHCRICNLNNDLVDFLESRRQELGRVHDCPRR